MGSDVVDIGFTGWGADNRSPSTRFVRGVAIGVASFWDWIWVWVTLDAGFTSWGADIKGAGFWDWREIGSLRQIQVVC